METTINRFLELFYKISEIPRESGKEGKFASFLEEFAKKHHLYCFRDESNNVLIKKKGNKESNNPIILQAHIDMVCVKRENSNHNFNTDSIDVIKDGDIIFAKDTSLGADQGIGLAIMLLVLESDTIKHPDLECMFTTEEETTFNGVVNFDYSKLEGKMLINLDHCKDDTIIIGSDADICNEYIFEGNLEENDLQAYEISVKYIKGGNSGVYIERSDRNAISVVSEIIHELQKKDDVFICSIDGGESEIDIATSCKAIVKTRIADIYNKIKELNVDGNIQICETKNELSFSIEDSKRIISQILKLKQGIVKKQDENIIVSGNIGVINTIENKVFIQGVLRSIDVEQLKKYNNENLSISENNHFTVKEIYQDSAWIPNKKSKLLDDYKKAYYRVNGSTPNVEIAHGGLECSSIMKRTNNMDIISIGSIIEDFHTVNERMYISSCEKTIKTLLEYLKK